jgi:hypothetical protein
MWTKSLAVVVLFTAISVRPVVAQTGQQIGLMDWRTAALDPSSTQIENEDVAEFLWLVLESETERQAYSNVRTSLDPVVPVIVGEFRWIDLDKDGVYELVATVSTTPRLIYNQVVIVRSAGGFRVERLASADVVLLRDLVADLDRDGLTELIVPTEYASGTGAHRIVWPAIFGSVNGSMIDVSSRHANYYLDMLSELHQQILLLQTQLQQGTKEERSLRAEFLAGRQMFEDRILSLAGQDTDAPSRRFDKWISSGDAGLRWLALRVIMAVPGPSAVEQLRRLANDTDPVLREAVATELRKLQKQ